MSEVSMCKLATTWMSEAVMLSLSRSYSVKSASRDAAANALSMWGTSADVTNASCDHVPVVGSDNDPYAQVVGTTAICLESQSVPVARQISRNGQDRRRAFDIPLEQAGSVSARCWNSERFPTHVHPI